VVEENASRKRLHGWIHSLRIRNFHSWISNWNASHRRDFCEIGHHIAGVHDLYAWTTYGSAGDGSGVGDGKADQIKGRIFVSSKAG